jgi:hypothetical protein
VQIDNAAFAYPEELRGVAPAEPGSPESPSARQSGDQEKQVLERRRQEQAERRKGKPETGARGAPLSWHLTHSEKDDITRRGLAIQHQFNEYRKLLPRLQNATADQRRTIEERLRELPLGAAASLVAEYLNAKELP